MEMEDSNPHPALYKAQPELLSKIKKILKSNGITQPISEVVVEGSGLKGENFMSVTKCLTVSFEDSSKPPLHLFVKNKRVADDGEGNSKVEDDLQDFQIESTFFVEYIPVAREFCKSVGHEEFMDIYPKCYFGDGKMIILEDLAGKDFVLLNKEELQDFETAKVALATLAKHHAISQAVIWNMGGRRQFLERFPRLETCPLMSEAGRFVLSPMIESGIDTNIDILEKCSIDGSVEAISKLKAKKGKAVDELLGSLKKVTTKVELPALVHGDYWNNNMMSTKDNETNEVKDQVIIDFQTVRYGSPCDDLSYYVFTSVNPTVRRGRVSELLAVYLKALKIAGNELGHQINITLEQLESDFCKRFYVGYWMGMDLATGPVYEVMKDLEEMDGDIEKHLELRQGLMTKWLEEHPDECKVKAQNIIDYVKEYEQFSSGLIT